MCQYCGCDANSHIGRLMAEHDDLVNLAGELRRAIATGDEATIAPLCDRMIASFDVHAEDEETGIFHEMKEADVLADKIDALCHEHHDLHQYLRAIKAGQWEQYTPFEHLLREHINAEDNGLFPAANIELDGSAWERIQVSFDAAVASRGGKQWPPRARLRAHASSPPRSPFGCSC